MKLEISTLDKAIVLAEALDNAMKNVQVSKATVEAMKNMMANGKDLGVSEEDLKQMEIDGERVSNTLEELILDLEPIIDALAKDDQQESPLPPPNWNGK